MAVLMNKEFLYCSVLGCSTATARVLFLTCEFTIFVVSQSWNVLVLMHRLGFLVAYIFMRRNRWYLPLNHFCERISVAGVVSWFVTVVDLSLLAF